MRTFEQLEAHWQAATPSPRSTGTVGLIVLCAENRTHSTPGFVEITPEAGLVGDRWGRDPHRNPDAQIAVMNLRAAETVCATHQPLHAPGDNLLVDLDLSEAALPIGTRLRIGPVLVEVTPKTHSGCRKFSDKFGPDALRWVNWKEFRPRRLRGVYFRAIEGGLVRVGDVIRRV